MLRGGMGAFTGCQGAMKCEAQARPPRIPATAARQTTLLKKIPHRNRNQTTAGNRSSGNLWLYAHLLSVLHMVVCMFPCCFLNASYPHIPSLCAQVCSLCLCLPYGCVNIWYCLSDSLHSNRLQVHPPHQDGLKCVLFLQLNNISLYICTAISVSIHLSMDLQVA